MEQFDKIYGYPKELRGRFNSFITTEFDDSMTVEMQLRVLVKWIKKNIDLTNDMVDFLNDFIEKFDKKLYSTVYDIMEEWSNSGYFSDLFDKLIMSKFLEYEPLKIHFPSMLTGSAGDCTILEQHKKYMMIDTFYSAEFESIVKPLIIKSGLTYIDILLITHYHTDHYTNIENLINHGYLTNESTVYIPMSAPQVDNRTGAKLTETILLLENHNINFVVMENDFKLDFSASVKIDVFNVDTSYYDGLTSNYNNCSVCCLVKHGGSTALFSGDIDVLAQERIMNEGYVKTQVDLYKMHHHAIDNEYSQKYATTIYPENIVIETSSLENSSGKTGRSQFVGYCSNSNVYNCGNNKKPFSFISYGSGFNNVDGCIDPHTTRNENIVTLYVDKKATGFQDGSQTYPFTELHQALGYVKNDRNTSYEINVADGDYSTLQNISNSNRTQSDIQLVNMISSIKLNLGRGVRIGGRLIIKNCLNVTINEFNSTINNNSPVTIENSTVFFSKLVVSGNTTNSFTGISINRSKVSLSNSKISGVNNGISAVHSHVFIRSTVISNVNTCIINTYSNVEFSINNVLEVNSGDELSVTEGSFTTVDGYQRVFQGDATIGVYDMELPYIKRLHVGYIINYTLFKDGVQISKGQIIRDNNLNLGIDYPLSVSARSYGQLLIGSVYLNLIEKNKFELKNNFLNCFSTTNVFSETENDVHITAVYLKTR